LPVLAAENGIENRQENKAFCRDPAAILKLLELAYINL
jgi:hypothetical protein